MRTAWIAGGLGPSLASEAIFGRFEPRPSTCGACGGSDRCESHARVRWEQFCILVMVEKCCGCFAGSGPTHRRARIRGTPSSARSRSPLRTYGPDAGGQRKQGVGRRLPCSRKAIRCGASESLQAVRACPTDLRVQAYTLTTELLTAPFGILRVCARARASRKFPRAQ
jgi:hypothetical protein